MLIYKATEEGPFEFTVAHDPSEILDYSLFWSLPVRLNTTKYLKDDIVYPSSRVGIYLVCTQPGITAASEPTISTVKGTKIEDGSVVWKVVHDTLLLQEGEDVSTSTWAITDSIPLTNESKTAISTTVFVGPVPDGVTSFTLTNTITTTSTPARTYERSLLIPVDDK